MDMSVDDEDAQRRKWRRWRLVLYVSVSHHLLRCSDGTEVIVYTNLCISDAEQVLLKSIRKPIQVAIVFFFIFFWIGKNQRCSYSSRDIVIMTVILVVTAKRFRRYHRSDKTVPCEWFSHFKGNNIQDILLLFQSNYLTIFLFVSLYEPLPSKYKSAS